MTFRKSSYSGHAVKTHVDRSRRMKHHVEKKKPKNAKALDV